MDIIGFVLWCWEGVCPPLCVIFYDCMQSEQEKNKAFDHRIHLWSPNHSNEASSEIWLCRQIIIWTGKKSFILAVMNFWLRRRALSVSIIITGEEKEPIHWTASITRRSGNYHKRPETIRKKITQFGWKNDSCGNKPQVQTQRNKPCRQCSLRGVDVCYRHPLLPHCAEL